MKDFIEITFKENSEKFLINVNFIHYVSSRFLKVGDFDLPLERTKETYESIKDKIERAKK